MPGRRTFILSATTWAASALFAQSADPPFSDEETSFRIAVRTSPADLPVPQQLDVTLVLEHSGAQPLVLSFLTSQDFEITIWNSNGAQVKTWSADKVFTPGVRVVELTGKKTMTATLSIADLPFGRYVMDGWMATEESRTYRAHVPFSIAARS